MMDGQREERGRGGEQVLISEFEHSVDKFFEVSNRISEICGDMEKTIDPEELQRFSSMVTFLKKWKYFNCKPKTVNFAYENEFPGLSKTVIKDIHLSQFSSASIPKAGNGQIELVGGKSGSLNCEDFILHAGGSVWSLDWCPRTSEISNSRSRCEYLAVAVHPPDSPYHLMGHPSTGRGIVQIWCILNVVEERESHSDYEMKFSAKEAKEMNKELKSSGKKGRGRPCKNPLKAETLGGRKEDMLPPKRRGRPRKQALAIAYPCDLDDEFISPPLKRSRGRPRKKPLPANSTSLTNDTEILTLVDHLDSEFEPDQDLLTSIDWSARDALTTKTSMLCNKMDKELTNGTISGLAAEEKSCSLKKGRGTPKKTNVLTKTVGETKHSDIDLMLHVYTDDVEESFPAEHIDRPRNQPLAIEYSLDKKNEFTQVWHSGRCRKNPARISNEDIGVRNYQMYEQVSTESKRSDEANSLSDLITTKEAMFLPCYSDLNDVNNLSMAKSFTITSTQLDNDTNIELGKDTSASPSVIEVVRALGENATLKICDKYEGLTVPEYNKSDLQNTDTKFNVNKHIHKLRIKDKARKIAASSVIPHDILSVQSHPRDSIHEGGHETSFPIGLAGSNYHKDLALPRLVLCLAHMGSFAWDVKWRPCPTNSFEGRCCMGYLAAVLGNGSLEVWDVPSPCKVKTLYNSCGKDGSDPRFLRLKPVFRCSVLKCGGNHSIPLTVEWSPSSPYDLILAGCHDGTVALWKFSVDDSSPDTRPLLCFKADSVPIRAIAWAPNESDPESANLMVTAGHESLKFWDIRDPYCPLWEFSPIQKHILSVDWVRKPRCVVLSFDDGTIRIVSLAKAISDAFANENMSGGLKPAHHYYVRSAFAIWSIHVSRVTGHVAYCGADGCARHFQLTAKSIEKEKSRNRISHYFCGSIVEDDQNICINILLPNVPIKDTHRCNRSLLSESNHASTENPNIAGGTLAIVPVSDSSKDRSKCKALLVLENSDTERDKPTETMGLVCSNMQSPALVESKKSKKNFPSKNIALHKVRWNISNGSQRWLCYGGAAELACRMKLFLIGARRRGLLAIHGRTN